MGFLRIFLASSVVLWHLGDGLAPINGYLAVICFYVISGFYMSMVINETYRITGAGWKRRFYLSRFLRLFPTYWVVALAALAFFPMMYGYTRFFNFDGYLHPLAWTLLMVSNGVIWGLDIAVLFESVLAQENFIRLVGPAWSLAIELQFYLLAPFIVTRSLRFCFTVLAATLLIRLSLIGYAYDPWRYFFAPSVWCFFIMGHVSHRASIFIPQVTKKKFGWAAMSTVFIVGAITQVWLTQDLDHLKLWFFYLVFAAALPFIFAFSKASSLDRQVGHLSYPLYLVHRPFFQIFAFLYVGDQRETLANLGVWWCIALLAAVVAISAAIRFGIEQPVDWLRARLRQSAVASPALVSREKV